MVPVVDVERHCPSKDFLPGCLHLSVALGSASAIWPEVITFPGQPALDRGTKYKDPAIAPRIIPRWNNSDG